MSRKYLASILLLFIFAGSCKNNNRSLVGKWRFVEIHVSDMSDESRKEYLNVATMEFTKNASFIFTTASRKQAGTYTYDKKTNTLITTVDHGTTDSIKVEWSGDKLILSHKDDSMTLKKE